MADLFETTFDGLVLMGDWANSGDPKITVILNSLFTDARAGEEDELPVDQGQDRRGYWADGLGSSNPWGSKLWLLSREKNTPETINKAREWAEQGLEHLLTNGLAKTINVHAEATEPEFLGLRVRVYWSDGTETELSWEYLWRDQTWRSADQN